MRESDFAGATGLLRVYEKRLLNSSIIEKIFDAPSPAEALNSLTQNSDYDFSGLKRPEDYEVVLQAVLKETYTQIYAISPVPSLVDILAAKYDYHNVKTALKAWYLQSKADNLYVDVTGINPQKVYEAIRSENTKELPEHISRAIEIGKEAYKTDKDPQTIDIALDKAMFAHMLKTAGSLDNAYVNRYLDYLIDFYNLKTLLRIKNMQKGLRFLRDALVPDGSMGVGLFLENYDKSMDNTVNSFYYKYFGDIAKKALDDYEKTGNFSGLEKLTDNFVLAHVKQSKYFAFGPEPLFAYVLAKENEIRQVRILLTCKINGISGDTFRERLRDNYA